MTARTENRNYGFEAMHVNVQAGAEDLQWLDEFLLPWFAPGDNKGSHRQIILCEDNATHLLLHKGTPAGDAVAGFILDGPPTRLEPRITVNGEAWHHDCALDMFYRLSGNTVELCSREAARENRFALARLVRELFMERAFASSAPVLHAAAVATGGKAALILGDKGAGKTTFSMHCVTRLGFDFIANDRAVVLPHTAGSYRAQGIPTLVRVRQGSVDLLPTLDWQRLAIPYSSRRTLADALAHNSANPASHQPQARFLSPGQHCWLMNCAPVPHAKLAALLFPLVDTHSTGLILESLDKDEVIANLRAGLFNRSAAHETNRLFGETLNISTLTEELASLANAVPGVRVRLGRHAFTDREQLWGLMAQL